MGAAAFCVRRSSRSSGRGPETEVCRVSVVTAALGPPSDATSLRGGAKATGAHICRGDPPPTTSCTAGTPPSLPPRGAPLPPAAPVPLGGGTSGRFSRSPRPLHGPPPVGTLIGRLHLGQATEEFHCAGVSLSARSGRSRPFSESARLDTKLSCVSMSSSLSGCCFLAALPSIPPAGLLCGSAGAPPPFSAESPWRLG